MHFIFESVQPFTDCLVVVFESEFLLRIHGHLAVSLDQTGKTLVIEFQKVAEAFGQVLHREALIKYKRTELGSSEDSHATGVAMLLKLSFDVRLDVNSP